MCKKEAETPRHLLLHCEVASELWSMFFCLSGINWTTPLTVKDAYESWSLWKVDKAIKKIWIMIPACIFWCIWLERNKRCFDGESTALGILKTRCTENLFSWTNLYPAVNAEQLQDFTNSLALA
uniref:Putative ovule protein n=1 Tax=Solanum chacoense TaxID=4108 RepID=A0A0V0ISS7_SOLCH